MAPSRRMTQVGKALMELRSLILNGELAPGERLSEPALAERLNISRTPLRSAMATLVTEGLLERLESGSCRVGAFSMQDILDSIELRGVLEGTAARLAAERGGDPAGLSACHDILDRIDAALDAPGGMDFAAYVTLNARFHDTVSRLAGSSIVTREVARAMRLPLASPSAFLQGQSDVAAFRKSLFGAQQQHKAILEAIENREGTRAEGLSREHARLARRNMIHAMTRDRSLVDRIPGLALVKTDETEPQLEE